MPDVTVIDGVISERRIFELYSDLIHSNMWALDRTSMAGEMYRSFPGAILYDEGAGLQPSYFSGYFMGIADTILCKFQEQNKYAIPHRVKRIHLGAKNDVSRTEFHHDTSSATAHTILGMLTPQWSPEWGGTLNVCGEEFEYTPGRFFVFKSSDEHNGGGPDMAVPYWRITLNIVVDD